MKGPRNDLIYEASAKDDSAQRLDLAGFGSSWRSLWRPLLRGGLVGLHPSERLFHFARGFKTQLTIPGTQSPARLSCIASHASAMQPAEQPNQKYDWNRDAD
jgi:hypothetical protein